MVELWQRMNRVRTYTAAAVEKEEEEEGNCIVYISDRCAGPGHIHQSGI